MKPLAAHRGQTMVLFVLTLLLLTLLVTMTLSIGSKVKEKMELQAVADAAAYSNAVVTARAYNEIALMSRAQIGHMVSMAGVQSLISWSSYYRAQVEASRRSYRMARIPYDIIKVACCIPKSPCKALCRCAKKAISDINDARDKLDKHQSKLKSKWDNLDKNAAAQMRMLQGANVALFAGQTERWIKLRDRLNGQSLAEDLVDEAKRGSKWPGEWNAPGSGDSVSLSETNPFEGAILPIDIRKDHHLYAGMGSRGFSFVTTRGGMTEMILTGQLKRQIPQRDQVYATNKGSAYFASKMNHGALQPSGAFAWADDHEGSGIANTVVFQRGQAPCPPVSVGISGATARLRSTDSRDDTDEHRWSPGGQSEEQPRHTLGSCVRCPGIWPLFVDYNPLHLINEGNNWGQPKNHAVIQRDYRQRNGSPDPWNLFFRFRFSSSPSTFDNRGIQLGPANGGIDISKQTALSVGIAYYHRHDHWKEPPNLLNPYWRATLVPFDVDDDGRGDVRKTLNRVGAGWATDAFNALGSGYKGGP